MKIPLIVAKIGTVTFPMSLPETSSDSSLSNHLQNRRFQEAEQRQNVRYHARHLPSQIKVWLKKFLWRSCFRHMHYVPPAATLAWTADRRWCVRIRGIVQPFISRPISEIRGITDRPAVVVATGPSGKEFDWQNLRERKPVIWAVNGAPTILAAHGLAADYLVITDHRFARDGVHHIQLALEQGATLLFSYESAAVFASARPDLLRAAPFHVFEKANGWYSLPKLNPDDLKRMNEASGNPYQLPEIPCIDVGWSRDPELGVFAGKTVTFAALQLAVWSGSPQIEVVGLDLGGKIHAYPEEKVAVSHLEKDRNRYILPAFHCLALALAGSGIEIINQSEISPLPRDLIRSDPSK